MSMRKPMLAAVILTTAALIMPTTAASADVDRGSLSPSCEYQRWYLGAVACEGYQWTISLAQECALIKASTPTAWAADPQCNDEMSRPRPRFWKVAKGDTLWFIAACAYSTGETPNWRNGRKYRALMKLNHLKSTKIRVGQILRLR